MNSLFETNAEKLRALHEAIKKTLPNRNKDQRGHEAWKQACHAFHTNYDSLAFPGGLTRAMSLAIKHDEETIEEIIRFLEADPFFFRSGYIKAEFLRLLRNVPLHLPQKQRLREVILARVHQKPRREFRWYCRLARVVATPEFQQRLQALSAPGNPTMVSRHAKWVLAQLMSS